MPTFGLRFPGKRLVGDQALLGILSFLMLAGFAAAVFVLGLVLKECVHALGHSSHHLSLAAQVFDDYSPLPLALPCFSLVTVIVLALSDVCLFRKVTDAAFLRYLALSTGLSFWVLFVLTLALVDHDFCHIPAPAWLERVYMHLLFYCIAVLGVSAASLLCLHFTARLAATYVFALFPLVPCLLIGYSQVVTYLEEFTVELPSLFCRRYGVLMGVEAILAAFLVLSLVARRRREVVMQMALLATGMWSSALCFSACFGILQCFHHMCITDQHVAVQRQALHALLVAFLVLWAGLIAHQLLRRRAVMRGQSR